MQFFNYIFINLKVLKNELIPLDVLELDEKALVWFYIIASCGPKKPSL